MVSSSFSQLFPNSYFGLFLQPPPPFLLQSHLFSFCANLRIICVSFNHRFLNFLFFKKQVSGSLGLFSLNPCRPPRVDSGSHLTCSFYEHHHPISLLGIPYASDNRFKYSTGKKKNSTPQAKQGSWLLLKQSQMAQV